MNHILNCGQRRESKHELRGRMKVTFTSVLNVLYESDHRH